MGIKVKPLSKNKKKKAKTKSRKPLSRRFKRPKRTEEVFHKHEELTLEELDRLLEEDIKVRPTEPIREWERPVDPWHKDDKEKGVYRDSEGDIIEIDVASGGMITKNYAKGGGVRKAKFIDS